MHIRPSRAFASVEETSPACVACRTALARSFGAALGCDFPYPHWMLADALPPGLVWALAQLPLGQPSSPVLGCVRPNAQTRWPFSRRETEDFAACRTVAECFQASETLASITRATGMELRDCRPRITLVREVDGYDCAPRTRCGDARFTLMVALDAGGEGNLGPDIYFESGDWASQPPWRAGSGLAFAPSPRSWHGFEPRMIRGVRTSLIVDYVRGSQAPAEKFAFPDRSAGRRV